MKREILFIHGMWSGPWVWEDWKARFEQEGFSCSTVTLKGHGEGEADSALKKVGLADYRTQVLKRVAEYSEPPILIGHSLGGLVTQQTAELVPLAAIVLINSAVPAPVFPLRPVMLPGVARHFAKPWLWYSAFRLSRWEADHLLFNGIARAERPAYYARLCAESGRIAYQVGFGALNRAGSNRVNRRAIACPMLALAGARDHIVPVGASRNLAAWYGEQLDYREFQQHAHWIMAEEGNQERADDVIRWLLGLAQP